MKYELYTSLTQFWGEREYDYMDISVSSFLSKIHSRFSRDVMPLVQACVCSYFLVL